MNVLVLNCGSSTLKFQVIETDKARILGDQERTLARGLVERIGGHALMSVKMGGDPPVKTDAPLRDHRAALDWVLRGAVSGQWSSAGLGSLADIHAVGHRVVHGGERFRVSARVDSGVISGIEDCIELAPLHNPANLKGIRAARELLGKDVPQVAVFDTAFHATMPDTSYLYGIPYHFYRRHKIRRYGFHGSSHRYLSFRYRTLRGIKRDQVNIIALHLGNGCSACAIKGGESFLTSMGFTPLEGLLMGTRSGDIDPSLIEYLCVKEGLSVGEVDTLLNKQSGLLGLSGLTGDMRELLAEEAEHGDRRAHLAIEIFCRRVRRYIGGYFAEMGGCEAVVFSGGIGENSAEIRRRICEGLECLGLQLDKDRNSALQPASSGVISRDGSRLEAYVIPTNEELLIARDTYRVVTGDWVRPA
ncbi:MAG: acetate kinase [Elusimicrobia bacterium]|nr:acetate kinase [Elusimicrobiota bacterium]